jgi:DNA-binding FadR family transcriptional regulator
MLGVGRSSVREAINALVVMGYLEPLQGKGTFIKMCCLPMTRISKNSSPLFLPVPSSI